MEVRNSLHTFLFIFSLLFLYWACEPSEEGCFDLLSSNYGFEAVNECDSCCVYPEFKIAINIVNDTIENALNDTLDLGGGDSLIFQNIEILFSEIEIQGFFDSYKIRDSIEINDINVRDDYVYFQSPTTKTVGRTRFKDTLQNISMILGFNESSLSSYTPFENIDISSNIDQALDSLYNVEEDVYYFSRIRIELKDSIRNLNLINLGQRIDFETDQIVDAGSDWTVSFNLDLSKLQEGILATMTNDMLEETFQQNLTSSLSLK